MSVWFDVHGEGPAVALVHAGVADSRMWEPQLRTFPETHQVVRVDLPGFGESPFERDVVSYRGAVREALDLAGVERAALVGTSLGGRAVLELALESPERVSALVLVGAGIDDHEWSEEVEAFAAEEEAALGRGDLEAAVNANLRLWLAGPRRSVETIDASIVRSSRRCNGRRSGSRRATTIFRRTGSSRRPPRASTMFECRPSSSPETKTWRTF